VFANFYLIPTWIDVLSILDIFSQLLIYKEIDIKKLYYN